MTLSLFQVGLTSSTPWITQCALPVGCSLDAGRSAHEVEREGNTAVQCWTSTRATFDRYDDVLC